MDHQYKGGNTRLMARLWDQFDLPLAVVDRQGEIIFVNTALCKLCAAEATALVGKRCSWQVAADSPHAAILTALAPPAGAIEGRAGVRRLLAPVVFGSTQTGQVFIPIKDSSGVVQWTLSVLGDIDQLQGMLTVDTAATMRPQPDRTLVQIRSRWKRLDGLLALVGESHAIQLAMRRCQMALNLNCHMLICGPGGVGKFELAQGIFLSRVKAAGLHPSQGQCFPIDCRKLDSELVDSLLEIFVGRLRSEAPVGTQQLVLTGIDRLSESAMERVFHWYEQIEGSATVVGTSSFSSAELISRGNTWQRLVSWLGSIEISLPALALRREDIAPLALQALSEACQQSDRAQLTLSGDALNLLEVFSWPGNVRQLRSAMYESVKSAVLTSAIQPNHLPVAIRTFPGSVSEIRPLEIEPIDLDEVLLDVERVMIRRALKLSPRNRSRAARLLGISRPRLLRRIEQLGLVDATPNLIEDEEEDDAEN